MKPVVFLFLSITALHGEDASPRKFEEIRLKNGHVYTDVSVRKVNVDSVSVIHSSGVTTIPFEQLAEADAKAIGLTNELVEKNRAERNEKNLAAAHDNLKKDLIKSTVDFHFLRVQGTILQVLPNGVLPNGVLLSNAEAWDGRYEWWDDPMINKRQILAITKKIETCFVKCKTSGMSDNQRFSMIVGESGTYSYVSTIGSQRTVRSFNTNLREVLREKLPGHNQEEGAIIANIEARYNADKMCYKVPIPRK